MCSCQRFDKNGLRSARECRLGCTSQSMMRSRVFAVASCSSTGRSMTSLMRFSLGSGLCGEFQPRKGFKRIVFTHARNETGGQMRRDRVVAVELPVRIIGREQEHLVGADHVDDVGDALGVGWAVEGL